MCPAARRTWPHASAAVKPLAPSCRSGYSDDLPNPNHTMTDQMIQSTFPWAYMPADCEKCPHTGFSRATIYRLLRRSNGRIKTVNLKEDGSEKGRRLFHVGSLFSYLDRLAAAQRAEEGAK